MMRRLALGLDTPLAEQVAARLVSLCSTEATRGKQDTSTPRPLLDLGSCLVVVPTRESGRLLRAALASQAGLAGGALLSPRVLTPESFLRSDPSAPETPSRAESVLTWAHLIADLEPQLLERIGGSESGRSSRNWRNACAERHLALRASLAHSDLDFAEAAQHPVLSLDRPRWEALAVLERRYRMAIIERGMSDPHDLERGFAASPRLDSAVRHLVLAAVPDATLLLEHALSRIAREDAIEVQIWIACEESRLHQFDGWGRPLPGATPGIIEIPDRKNRVRLFSSPRSQADWVLEEIRRFPPEAREAIAVISCDEAVGAALAWNMSEQQLPAYRPQQGPGAASLLEPHMRNLELLLQDGPFHAWVERFRSGLWIDLFSQRAGCETPFVSKALGRFLSETHATSLQDAAELAAASSFEPHSRLQPAEIKALRRIWQEFQRFVQNLRGGPLFAVSLEPLLCDLAAQLSPDAPVPESITAEARQYLRLAAQLAKSEELRNLDFEASLSVLNHQYSQVMTSGQRTEGAIEILGWLEALWTPHPHLFICGCNEGFLPTLTQGDAYLPDSARQALGLLHNETRFARDAYLLETILQLRRKTGTVDFSLGRQSERDESLAPSRLLLKVTDHELPGVVQSLFQDPPGKPHADPAAPMWKLTFPSPAAPPLEAFTLSATEIRAYLNCPFRYYLRYHLKMDPVPIHSRELQPVQFGILLHSCLEQLNRSEEGRRLVQYPDLRDFLLAALEDTARIRFGQSPGLHLEVQLSSARDRLAAAAQHMADSRQEGWVPVHVEWRIHADHQWQIGSARIHGMIDLVEHHQLEDRYRIVDYKTSDSAVQPWSAHVVKLSRRSTPLPDDLAAFAWGGENWRWLDLQLPVYALAARALLDLDPHRLSVAYFNLPKALASTGYASMDELDDNLLAEAQACAERVASAIAEGRFWPPHPRPAYDDFSEWFPFSAEEECALAAPEQTVEEQAHG